MKTISRYIMTLALLLTAVTGAWAQEKITTIPNGDFETWTYDGEDMPNNWNSNATSDGNMSTLFSGKQVKRSTDVRPGSSGQYSCSIWSKSVMGVTNIGILTSGRIHFGATSSASNANYIYSDRDGSNTKNNVTNPCAMPFTGKPTAVKVWVKYVQGGTGYGEYATAKFSATIHGDADYVAYNLAKDDNDDNKALVVASAEQEIAYNNGEWEQLTIPFNYTDNNVDPAYILINAYTNAYPGKGKADDYLYIDDIELEYAPEPGIDVTPGETVNQWTFAMPAFDVVLSPIYAKAAAFATTGTEPEATMLLPEAAEGVIAGTDASLIAEGTGIVAFAGTSTEVTQGTLMYAIGTSATEAPALTDFSATVPTAKNVDDDGADVYVWYYIQGADAPEGVAATLDNTFNNTEPACLTVTVLTNKFDIQFNAANANTIEAGKATVTVGGTAATVTEGKLQGVKMGSEVKLEAKPGYKFRKVEVKKKGDGPLAAAFKDGAKIKVGYQWNFGYTTYLEFTNSGGTYSLTSVSGLNEENGFNSSTLTAKDGNVLALDVVCQPNGDRMDEFGAQIEFDATSSTYKYSSKGEKFTGIISVSVNDTDVTDQLSELK